MNLRRDTFSRRMAAAVVIVFLFSGCANNEAGTASLPGLGGLTTADDPAPGDDPLPEGDLLPEGDPLPGGDVDGFDENRTKALDMSVRVANLYVPQGETEGVAIEVWAGSPEFGGKNLMTVPYGSVSEYFAPEINDSMGNAVVEENTSYTLNFFAEGEKSLDNALMSKGETSYPGLKTTILAMQGERDGRGAAVQTWADDLGSAPDEGVWFDPFPTAPDGKALLMVSAAATQRLDEPDTIGGYMAVSPSGECLQYFDSGPETIHDDENSTSLAGGTQPIVYVTDPGQDVGVVTHREDALTDENCADEPSVGPENPGLEAGGTAYAFIYGPTKDDLKFLLVPRS